MAEPLTPEHEAQIRERLAAATQGPWHAVRSTIDHECSAVWCARHRLICEPAQSHEDADLIANAPSDLAALLAEVERLRAERDAAKQGERAAVVKWAGRMAASSFRARASAFAEVAYAIERGQHREHRLPMRKNRGDGG